MAGNHRSGRRPLPADKLKRRNPRRDDPKFDPLTEVPPAPKWLGPHGRAEWRRVVAQLIREGVVTVADVPTLVAYVSAFDTAVESELTIRSEGRMVEDVAKGRRVAHPLVSVARLAWREVRTLGAEFGLTPATRPKLGTKLPQDAEPDPLALFAASRHEAG